MQTHIAQAALWIPNQYRQGRIEPPEVVRGHTTSYSARIDGIVLSVTKITFPVKLRARYGYGRSMERFPGRWCYRFRYRNAIQAISRPSTSSSPGTSPTSVAGQIRRKYRQMQAQHLPLSTTVRRLLLRKLEGGNDSIKRGSR